VCAPRSVLLFQVALSGSSFRYRSAGIAGTLGLVRHVARMGVVGTACCNRRSRHSMLQCPPDFSQAFRGANLREGANLCCWIALTRNLCCWIALTRPSPHTPPSPRNRYFFYLGPRAHVLFIAEGVGVCGEEAAECGASAPSPPPTAPISAYVTRCACFTLSLSLSVIAECIPSQLSTSRA